MIEIAMSRNRAGYTQSIVTYDAWSTFGHNAYHLLLCHRRYEALILAILKNDN